MSPRQEGIYNTRATRVLQKNEWKNQLQNHEFKKKKKKSYFYALRFYLDLLSTLFQISQVSSFVIQPITAHYINQTGSVQQTIISVSRSSKYLKKKKKTTHKESCQFIISHHLLMLRNVFSAISIRVCKPLDCSLEREDDMPLALPQEKCSNMLD